MATSEFPNVINVVTHEADKSGNVVHMDMVSTAKDVGVNESHASDPVNAGMELLRGSCQKRSPRTRCQRGNGL